MRNLVAMLARADHHDRKAGLQAYETYHSLMVECADLFSLPVDAITGAFVALSPNSDYHGNLRSLISCCHGLRDGVDPERITVSTYKHCRDRALLYLTGTPFLDHAKGPKTRAFYSNILNPRDPAHVTVDGHIWCVWQGVDAVMKDVKMSLSLYRDIQRDVIELANACQLVPCQLQATLWFTRKRVSQVLYDPQLDFFADPWRVNLDVQAIKPYPVAKEP